MKISLVFGSALAALLSFVPVAGAASEAYTATLKGSNMTPPNTSDAAGSATLVYDTTTGKLTGTVTFAGLHDATDAGTTTATAAHIHDGPAGVAGGVIVELGTGDAIPSPITVDVTIPEGTRNAFEGGETYIAIHSGAYSGGEIRGQIEPADVADGGAGDAGPSSSDGGSKGDGGNGATTERPDSGTSNASTGDDGGCRIAGNNADFPSNTALFAASAVGIVAVLRSRDRARRPSRRTPRRTH
jgi:hypothetical protein